MYLTCHLYFAPWTHLYFAHWEFRLGTWINNIPTYLLYDFLGSGFAPCENLGPY